MDKDTAYEIWMITFWVLLSTLIPSIAYYTYRFWKLRDELLMIYRNPVYVLCFNLLIIFGAIIRAITHIDSFPIHPDSTFVFTALYCWSTILLLCIKAWLLYFKHRHHLAVEDISWKQQISSGWSNWYLDNKHRWGSFTYLIKVISIPFIIIMIVQCCLGFGIIQSKVFGHAFNMFVALVPVILMAVFIVRMRNFTDSYGIRKEMTGQAISLVAAVFIYFGVVFAFSGSCDEQGAGVFTCQLTSRMLNRLALLLSFSYLALSSVCTPLKMWQKEQLHLVPTKSEDNSHISLRNVMEDKALLSLFMQHATTEFNTENLLFLVELSQIKHQYQQTHDHVIRVTRPLSLEIVQSASINSIPSMEESKTAQTTTVETSTSANTCMVLDLNPLVTDVPGLLSVYLFPDLQTCIPTRIRIPVDLPQSDIVTNYDTIEEQMKQMCQKYIMDDAKLQVNLSSEIQETVMQFLHAREEYSMGDEPEGDWYCALDEVGAHVMRLLMNPLSRFRLSEQYTKYIAEGNVVPHVELITTSDRPLIYDDTEYDDVKLRYHKSTVSVQKVMSRVDELVSI